MSQPEKDDKKEKEKAPVKIIHFQDGDEYMTPDDEDEYEQDRIVWRRECESDGENEEESRKPDDAYQ